jgi:hypothetical protein
MTTPAQDNGIDHSEYSKSSIADPYKSLWSEVIYRAVMDATGFYSTNEHLGGPTAKAEVDRATKWFENCSRDFVMVCELAGLNHEAVRQSTLKLIAEHKRGDPDGVLIKRMGRIMRSDGISVSISRQVRGYNGRDS